jgi:hypothetical protein
MIRGLGRGGGADRCHRGTRADGNQFGLNGRFWDGTDALNANFKGLGFALFIGTFILAWLASMVIYRYARIGDWRQA